MAVVTIMGSEAAKVEIISTQIIKPSMPTPKHLKAYKLSVFDQLTSKVYMGWVLFYLNNDHPTKTNEYEEEVVLARREILKKSLSQTLSQLYPLAGELGDDGLHINCNDNGVYYVEARVRDRLSDFLSQPKHDEVGMLLPFPPKSQELAAKTYMVMVQVNIFSCGGMALGVYTSHKIADAQTKMTILRLWGEQARGEGNRGATKEIFPDLYTLPSIFVQDHNIPKRVEPGTTLEFKEKGMRSKSARRFVFDASDLNDLKAKTGATSRVVAVMGLLWKCAVSAAEKRLGNSQKSACLLLPMNLRQRLASRLPVSPYSVGNLVLYNLLNPAANGLKLEMVTRSLKEGIAQIKDENIIKLISGESVSSNFLKIREEMERKVSLCFSSKAEHIVASSFCRAGTYEVDFGWGKPIWSTYGGASKEFSNVIFLTDTRSGAGIEAFVYLDEANMKIMEKDPELLTFATLDPSPLNIDNLLPRAHP